MYRTFLALTDQAQTSSLFLCLLHKDYFFSASQSSTDMGKLAASEEELDDEGREEEEDVDATEELDAIWGCK